MKPEDFKTGEKVIYIPNHAHGNIAHPECEIGKVSSVNHKFVFVKFLERIHRFGWDNALSEAVDPNNLEKLI